MHNLLLLAMISTVASQTDAASRPDVVVIMVDDMGWSDPGCYGGEIETPNLDALAEDGVRFTQFYNTARCCPTRAALLTGLYQHQAGVGHMVRDDGIPSYQGYLNDRCLTLAETLGQAGYATMMTGKWHVGSAPGRWPADRGFDRFWGTPSGGGVYFKDSLQIRQDVFFVESDRRIEPPDDLYVTDTFTDQAIGMLREHFQAAGSRPFFLYVAHIAPHWPLQAKAEDIAKYRGRYDIGWDDVRRRRFERQREMNLLPQNATLSRRHPQAKAWDEVSENVREGLAHRMAVYAAQVDCIDRNVGRLVDVLKEQKRLDNTLILFLSDNGCSAEGGPGGFSRGRPDAAIGTGLSYASVGLEWANASDTPFRKFKMDVHEGGIATPLIAHWPAGMKTKGRVINEPGHVIDVAPTLYEVADAKHPATRKDMPTLPLEGVSLKPLLTGQADRLEGRTPRPLFWEHQGNKAVRLGNWKAVTHGSREWELYDIENDRTETQNVADQFPEKVGELASLWRQWADRCGVMDYEKLQERRAERRRQTKAAKGADKRGTVRQRR